MTATQAKPKRPGRPILSTYVDSETKAEAHAVAAERNTTVSALLRDGLAWVIGNAGGEDAVAVLNDNDTKEAKGVP